MNLNLLKFLFAAMFLVVAVGASDADARSNPCNPCGGMSNPCNPCGGMSNPCNPCGGKMNACNPCNPCGKSKPKPIRSNSGKSYKKMVTLGKKLWNNENLGKGGLSCMDCHEDYELFNSKEWPHYVKMPNDVVTLDQMVNFCMINPMEAKQLDPNSIEMTAISAYYKEYVKRFKPGMGKKKRRGGNPCNPCGMKRNPCNPCGR